MSWDQKVVTPGGGFFRKLSLAKVNLGGGDGAKSRGWRHDRDWTSRLKVWGRLSGWNGGFGFPIGCVLVELVGSGEVSTMNTLEAAGWCKGLTRRR